MSTIKIILADDHTVVRNGLQVMLSREGDLELIGQAPDGNTAVKLCNELSPDVIVMDIGMPGMDGISATQKIIERQPDTKIIALSMHNEPNYISEMFEAGASGYLLKDCVFDQLADAIRIVASGGIYVGDGIAK